METHVKCPKCGSDMIPGYTSATFKTGPRVGWSGRKDVSAEGFLTKKGLEALEV